MNTKIKFFVRVGLLSIGAMLLSGCVGQVIGVVLSPLDKYVKDDNFSYCYGDQILVVNHLNVPLSVYASGTGKDGDQLVWTLAPANDPIHSHHIITPAPWLFNGRNVLFTAIGGQKATSYAYHSSNQAYNAGQAANYQAYEWQIYPQDMH